MGYNMEKVDNVFLRLAKRNDVHEAIVLLESLDKSTSYNLEYGGKTIDTPFLAASITKLFTTTCLFILQEQGKLTCEDKLTPYLGNHMLDQLHVYKGKNYSEQLTIIDLLRQTSGLCDAIDEGSKGAKQRAIYTDTDIGFSERIEQTKKTKPRFAPNTRNRAHYANINFDILGEIIEQVTGLPLVDVYREYIFRPLDLENTYLPQDDGEFVPNVYYKDRSLHRPKAVQSSGASGGAISTARELMIFLKAFFTGTLFESPDLTATKTSKKLQFAMYPIQYGVGYMKIPMTGLTTMFIGKGELIGHSGSTGSFAFYYPEKEIFLVGDVNQMANPALPVRTAIQLAMSLP